MDLSLEQKIGQMLCFGWSGATEQDKLTYSSHAREIVETMQAGGIILVRNDPRDVVRIIRLSRASYRKMVQNLFWATGYNVVAIPLATGILANYGILPPPALGALFMSASTVIVALNAQLLRRIRL